jgi:hypothetical protein
LRGDFVREAAAWKSGFPCTCAPSIRVSPVMASNVRTHSVAQTVTTLLIHSASTFPSRLAQIRCSADVRGCMHPSIASWRRPSRGICDSITSHTLLTFRRFGGDRNDCKGQNGRGGPRRLLQALATRTLGGVVALRGGDIVGTARARPAVSTRSKRWRYECTQLRYESVGCSARLADSAGVFEQLFEEQVQLCIWRRAPDEILRAYLERSVRSGAWERRMEVSIREPGLDEKVRGASSGI